MRRASALLVLALPLTGALPRAQAPTLTLARSIGCAECGGPDEFGTILDVAADSLGGVLVVADAAPILRRFDASGRLRWSGATTGRGPGEFVRPMRGVLGPDGVQVVDMTQRRVSRFDTEGRHRSSVPLRGFPAAVASRGRSGRFVVLHDDFRGGLTLVEYGEADSGRMYAAIPESSEPSVPGVIVFPALASARSGDVAFARDINTYSIRIVGADGSLRRTITRDVAQERRTAAELAFLERTRARAEARAEARAGAARAPAGPRAPAAPRVGGDPDLKPHIAIDGMRFDDDGRLWVRTMRGDELHTVFDVFSPAGRFLGEVRVDGSVGRFSFAGPWLALAMEDAEGLPVVRIFRMQ